MPSSASTDSVFMISFHCYIKCKLNYGKIQRKILFFKALALTTISSEFLSILWICSTRATSRRFKRLLRKCGGGRIRDEKSLFLCCYLRLFCSQSLCQCLMTFPSLRKLRNGKFAFEGWKIIFLSRDFNVDTSIVCCHCCRCLPSMEIQETWKMS